MAKLLVTDIGEMLTLAPAMKKQGRKISETDLGFEKNQAMYIENGKIAWLGPHKKIPKEFSRIKKLKEVTVRGETLVPGFVECHTHLVFAGHRAAEFEMRNQGVSYQEIAKKGGGILSTMKATRSASALDLQQAAQLRVENFVAQGVTAVEIKSGYGLDLKNELKILKVAKSLEGPQIITTFLGAHARPPEYSSYAEYLKFLVEKVLPQVKKQKLSERVDIFVEEGFFGRKDSGDFLRAAQGLGFRVLLHADQITLSGGAELAVELKALSGDHLLQIQRSEIHKLAHSDVTCVLLPAADLYMKSGYPPARKLIEAGARVALATDFNPGSSPTQDLALVGLLARLEMKMSLAEVISAYTVAASYALDLHRQMGSLELGKDANFMCTNNSWQELFYNVGSHQADSVYRNGRRIF
jgi:imidazolonepropionase